MKFVDTFEKHRQEPYKSLDAYTKTVRLQLGEEIGNCKKIYLDTNYWIELRDVVLGRSNKDTFIKLLSLLQKGVNAGQLICPISDENFHEILLQSDPSTLIASANLIDQLSKGVVLLSSEERIQFEILYFIQSSMHCKSAIHQPNIFVWSKVAFVYGTQHPTSTSFPLDAELVIQKAFFDQMWSISLVDMINTIGIEKIANRPKYNDISSQLNTDKLKYAHENRSFKQLFLSELAGTIDLYEPLFEKSLIYLFEKDHGHIPTEREIKDCDSGKQIANAIYNIFKKNKLGNYVPSIIIGAGLHASVRHDLQRKFQTNDMSDFRHAQAALPYFDYFFTEHNLRDLVSRNNLKFDVKYTCIVKSAPVDAIDQVNEILYQ